MCQKRRFANSEHNRRMPNKRLESSADGPEQDPDVHQRPIHFSPRSIVRFYQLSKISESHPMGTSARITVSIVHLSARSLACASMLRVLH